MADVVNLGQKLAQFSEYWAPRTVAQYNGDALRVVKVKGEFVWHTHPETDECFYVLQGRLTIQMRDREVVLNPGELFVVPRGTEHRPVAEEETHLLLIDPMDTPNTGDPATAAPQRSI